MATNDLIGEKFGTLTVIEFSHKDKSSNYFFKVQCDCGATKIISRNHLKNGSPQSCGCSRSQDQVGEFAVIDYEKRLKQDLQNGFDKLGFSAIYVILNWMHRYTANQPEFKNVRLTLH